MLLRFIAFEKSRLGYRNQFPTPMQFPTPSGSGPLSERTKRSTK
jgi:hypothetical protein